MDIFQVMLNILSRMSGHPAAKKAEMPDIRPGKNERGRSCSKLFKHGTIRPDRRARGAAQSPLQADPP
ncbi:MAG: hypothetical protein C6W56_11375 [Caldibacillus debilis]|nr:MAG: hypothetical protein C6W56_11375 [Caldibacillus debilis]